MIDDEEKLLEIVSRTSSDEIVTIDFEDDDPPSPGSSHSLLQSRRDDDALDGSKHTTSNVIQLESGKWVRIVICTMGVLIMAVIVCGILRVYSWNSHLQSTLIHNDDINNLYTSQNSTFKLVLFGDSLINMPFENFNLGGLLQSSITIPKKQTSLTIINEGKNSNAALKLYERINQVIARNPDAVLLLWDSDVSDTAFENFSGEELETMDLAYINLLRDILSTFQEHNIKHIAVSGPILLGEGTWFVRKKLARNGAYINHFIEMNRAVCEEMKVKYIDLHNKFEKKLPWYWFPSRYYLTVDGEHPNRKGTKLIAKVFAKVVNGWLVHYQIQEEEEEE
jgi:hypothetical protein